MEFMLRGVAAVLKAVPLCFVDPSEREIWVTKLFIILEAGSGMIRALRTSCCALKSWPLGVDVFKTVNGSNKNDVKRGVVLCVSILFFV